MATKTASVTLAVIGEKVDDLKEHFGKLERIVEIGNKAYVDICVDIALSKRDVEQNKKQEDIDSKAQWKQIDWLRWSVIGLIVAVSILTFVITGKLLGLKIPII